MKAAVIVMVLTMFCAGCDMITDMFSGETIPIELPPVPQECERFAGLYEDALWAAYTTLEGSQFKANTLANKFSECMKNAGLTSGEAKGIVQDIESTVRREADKS